MQTIEELSYLARMTWKQIEQRIKRLEVLSAGLSKEMSNLQKIQYPLHYAEKIEYLEALHAAIRALETARVALVKAKHRNEA